MATELLLRVWSDLLDCLAPLACPLCGGRLTADSRCPGCDLPPAAEEPLRQLRGDREGLFLVFAAGPYERQLRELVHAWKFRGDPGAARLLARAAAQALPDGSPWEALVPVPGHPRRVRERGWEPAGELAAAVGRAHGLPVRRTLSRVRDTPPLTGRAAHERRRLVRDAFRSRPTVGRLLVVDDVVTTGSTFRACRRALLAAGADAADLLVAAATPRRF